MHPLLTATASRQAGLITRRQAVKAGLTERQLRTLTAVHGPWVTVRRGVYCDRDVWLAAGERFHGQALLKDRAADLMIRVPHLLSHDSAARALDIPFLNPELELTHITREGVGGTRTEHGICHHLTRLGLLNTLQVGTMTTTGYARTAIDLARLHGPWTGVIAMDHVLSLGFDVDDLAAELACMSCWPHITSARAALTLSREGADSPGESLARVQINSLGLGMPDTQFPVRTPQGTFWADLRLGCHLVEFDGHSKFVRRESGGLADRPIDDVMWDERSRQLAICEQGFGLSRVTWTECLPGNAATMLARVAREIEVTRRRFGDHLPERHARFAEQMAGERRRRMQRRRLPERLPAS